MRIVIIFLFLLVNISCVYTNVNAHEYSKLIKHLKNCDQYHYSDSEYKIEYQILGKKYPNLCIYIEKDKSGSMICNHSKYGISVTVEYLKSIKFNKIINTTAVEQMRAAECKFYSTVSNDSESSEDSSIINDQIAYEIEIKKREKKLSEIRSIFFTSEEMEFINSIKNFDINIRR